MITTKQPLKPTEALSLKMQELCTFLQPNDKRGRTYEVLERTKVQREDGTYAIKVPEVGPSLEYQLVDIYAERGANEPPRIITMSLIDRVEPTLTGYKVKPKELTFGAHNSGQIQIRGNNQVRDRDLDLFLFFHPHNKNNEGKPWHLQIRDGHYTFKMEEFGAALKTQVDSFTKQATVFSSVSKLDFKQLEYIAIDRYREEYQDWKDQFDRETLEQVLRAKVFDLAMKDINILGDMESDEMLMFYKSLSEAEGYGYIAHNDVAKEFTDPNTGEVLFAYAESEGERAQKLLYHQCEMNKTLKDKIEGQFKKVAVRKANEEALKKKQEAEELAMKAVSASKKK